MDCKTSFFHHLVSHQNPVMHNKSRKEFTFMLYDCLPYISYREIGHGPFEHGIHMPSPHVKIRTGHGDYV
jgi:hypothetical protein